MQRIVFCLVNEKTAPFTMLQVVRRGGPPAPDGFPRAVCVPKQVVDGIVTKKWIAVAVVRQKDALHLEVESRRTEACDRLRVLHPSACGKRTEHSSVLHVRSISWTVGYYAEIGLPYARRQGYGSTLQHRLTASRKRGSGRTLEEASKIPTPYIDIWRFI